MESITKSPENDPEEEEEIKIILYQSYRKIHSTAPSEPPKTSRPFRRGEKRLDTFTTRWQQNVDPLLLSNPEQQLDILRNIENQPNAPFLKSLISRKLKSYADQDAKKQFHNENENENESEHGKTITVPDTIQLLVSSQMTCYYCQETTLFFYETVREPRQWTLERLNNEYPHTKDNVVIACLQCNLRRRCMNSERYQRTKQMMEIHKEES